MTWFEQLNFILLKFWPFSLKLFLTLLVSINIDYVNFASFILCPFEIVLALTFTIWCFLHSFSVLVKSSRTSCSLLGTPAIIYLVLNRNWYQRDSAQMYEGMLGRIWLDFCFSWIKNSKSSINWFANNAFAFTSLSVVTILGWNHSALPLGHAIFVKSQFCLVLLLLRLGFFLSWQSNHLGGVSETGHARLWRRSNNHQIIVNQLNVVVGHLFTIPHRVVSKVRRKGHFAVTNCSQFLVWQSGCYRQFTVTFSQGRQRSTILEQVFLDAVWQDYKFVYLLTQVLHLGVVKVDNLVGIAN